MSLCVVTNVYNEAFNLPIWLRYYGAQVGIANCLVVDHGSDDGSTDDLRGAGRITLPRSPLDEELRAVFLSDLANSLLRMYDTVIYVDCDEFLVADPDRFADLTAFAAAMKAPAVTAIGLNLVHHTASEPAIDASRPLLAQRRHAQFASPMCKTLVVREAVRWSNGFHASSHPPQFGGLYLFHTRWVDRDETIRRMAITRTLPRETLGHGAHQRIDDAQVERRFAVLSRRAADAPFDFDDLAARFVGETAYSDGLYHGPRDLRQEGLALVPPRFARSGL